MARVAAKDLVKRFGKVLAVDHVNFEARDGEFLVLLGPSGCGKTTTLRMIAGLETPDEGEIYIGEKLVNDLPPKDRDVAMVFQNYALYPHMKVYDNIAFPLRVRKVPKDEIDQRVREVAKLLRIEDLLDRYPRQLSGGQQQRVALGRALVRKPQVFLMDEPLSNLDAKLRVYMRAELKRLQRELGITTIYVTHDQAEAMTMADRVAVMNEGKIMQLAEPAELYYKPANTFVAGFIGAPAMNFIEASLVKRDGEYVLDTGVFKVPLPKDFVQFIEEAGAPSEVILGIRPEHIEISREKTPEGFEVEVFVTEPLGSETIIDFRHGDAIVKAKYPGLFEARHGDKVWVRFKMKEAHIFDKKTGKAIV
ncbi:MAG: ABC transporter ATP-binding protein [Infirmifilum sp.]|jgi:multiple sugar transport system ATP-binding protein|uniref:Sugar ABC transporter ATP-binding protein n=1 Tax=Infirmifilum uzonense TaxID=1550241 RepID=A0A0F7FI68_9CREN|nr:ABC transporter ATP-binding protein [Infirmifilum uzonense]AKG38622.1 sugar ABC transporter ATP-binding protein [Infirmifilum uzonense]